ncbi:HAD family hydrolase [Pseudogracilibacillus auburnensis]|uniref:HAD superfamily hydrolase (TIGR01509 family)/HAD superfamily hydrolase (TIGR01549 family) n=2 Tax=Pseudogracilibacillus auburnensis TaxID=1494959 RepID=A0A2V3VPM9_9BACI|nr:HAD superfamily hydrolase (TIGR01509 family)/HAD superfamily hydrolase (TIGR01549 family) [Pseudogracilibacillus auburnensis]
MDNIKALGIKKYVDTILISEWEGIKKPDPKIFLKAIEKLHVEPNQCVFVGDHPENDIHAAKNVGMKSIWKRDYQWDHANADYIIDDLLEVPNIIKKMKG